MNHNIANVGNTAMRGNISFGNAEMRTQMPTNHNQQQVALLPQPQTQGRPYFPGHFQPSEAQAQAFPRDHPVQGQVVGTPHVTARIGISSPTAASPGSGTPGVVRRTQRPPSRPSGLSSAQGTSSPMKTMELSPTPVRGKRKLPDKATLYKIAAIFPEASLFTQLLEFESRVDASLSRKKNDILESLKNPMSIKKVLRIYVFNTYSNQIKVDPEKENPDAPSWSLRIIGGILENEKDSGGEHMPKKSLYPKFSSFFKKITIYLDQAVYPDNHVIVWDSSRSPVLHEGFEVKRKGDKEFTAVIRFEMKHVPEKFKLSPALQEVLGIELETRPKIMAALWQYVKMKRLQVQGDISWFMCDEPLKKVFGEEKMKFSMVSQKITSHITSPGPIHLEHRVKLSGPSPAGNTCYDVLVDIPLSTGKKSSFLASLEKNKEIDVLDESIASSMKKICEHYRRQNFFLGFSQSPAEFINALIASQARDLKLFSADASGDIEKEKRAEFYNQPWVEDAVIRYLNRKSPLGTDGAVHK